MMYSDERYHALVYPVMVPRVSTVANIVKFLIKKDQILSKRCVKTSWIGVWWLSTSIGTSKISYFGVCVF